MVWARRFRAIFIVQAVVNLVGALGPEISFDALWYHLPIARLAVERGWWGVIPGGLLYTTGAPRLVDFLNAGLLYVGGALQMESPELLPKLLSYSVGLMSAMVIYRIARLYTDKTGAWGAVILWYGSLVVGWQSIVVYVDLHRTFLTLVAVWYVIRWWRRGRRNDVVMAGLMWALAYSTKIMALIDVIFVAGVLLITDWKRRRGVLTIVSMVAVVVGIWGLSNKVQDYHYLYPFVGNNAYLPAVFGLRDSHIWSPLLLFVHSRFRTGPVILVPLIIAGRAVWKKIPRELVLILSGLSLSWWFAPANMWKGDGRYFLPTLAIIAIVGGYVLGQVRAGKRRIIVAAIVMQGVVGIVYRGAANIKFLPFVFGYESKSEFLSRELNFDYGDWYDVDGEVERIVDDEKYIVYGVHNTYYLPGNFYHFSFARESCYPYVLVQGEEHVVDEEDEVVYQNDVNRSALYRHECK